MDSTTQDNPSQPVKKAACTECRQQKARCDAHLHDHQPCSRCRRLNLSCIISNKFKRQHKRERLSELEQEAEALRKRLKTAEPTSESISPLHPPQPPPPSLNTSSISLAPTLSIQQSYSSTVQPRASINTSNGYVLPTRLPDENTVASPLSEPTIARSLSGILVTAHETDQLFQIFFRSYAPSLPILDPRITPNTCHAQSEFLYWSIITVACRKSPSHSHLFSTLAQPVTDLAFTWPNTPSKPLYGIQAMLLLLTWPFPRCPNKLDVTYPLADLLISKAKQAGFHRPRASHEFYFVRERTVRLTEAEIAVRKDLWVRSVLVYQSIAIDKGQLPNRMNNPACGYHTETPDQSLGLQLKCHDIITQCCTAVVDNGLDGNMSHDQKHAMGIILQIFDNRLGDLEVDTLAHITSRYANGSSLTPSLSTIDKFHIQSSKLNVQIFHLYIHSSDSFNDFDGPIASLLSTARTVIDLIEGFVQAPSSPPDPPNHIANALMFASFVILRIVKTGSAHLRIKEAESYVVRSIHLAKELSSDKNDLYSKTATILGDLWKHPGTYKSLDGSPDMSVRVLNRLTAGLVIDAAWRWFDIVDEPPKQGIAGPAENGCATTSTDLDTSSTNPASAVDTLPAPSTATGDDFVPNLFDDHIFADFNWALGDDYFYL